MCCYWNMLEGGVTGNVQPVTLPCICLEQRWELQEDEWMVHVVLFRFICRSKTLSSYALIPTLEDANASIREPRYNGTGHRCLLWSVTFSARRGLFCSWCKAANAGAMLQGFVSDASRLKLRKDVWWVFFFLQFLHKLLLWGKEAVEKLALPHVHWQGPFCSRVYTKQTVACLNRSSSTQF